MTIITAISDGKTVWTGHNSACTIGDMPVEDGFDPWVTFGDWVLGLTGESAVQDFLEFHVESLNAQSQSIGDLVLAIRSLLLDNNIFKNGDKPMPSFEIWCLVVHKATARIWDMNEHLSVTQINPGKVWATGAGCDFALGADYALRQSKQDLSPEARLRIVTDTAIACSIDCPGTTVVRQL